MNKCDANNANFITMQFQIPQFIETEDKILGPLTLKQLLYLTGAGILSFIGYFLLQFWAWVLITFIALIFAISLAFIKYNGQPLIKVAGAALSFLWKPRLFLWKRAEVREGLEEKILSERESLEKFSFGMPAIKKLLLDLTTGKSGVSGGESSKNRVEQGFSVFRKITGEKEVVKRVDYR